LNLKFTKPEYLNKELASKYSGLSVRRLLELASAGKIRRKHVRDPRTRRDIAVFHADDIRALRERASAGTSVALQKSSPVRSLAAPPHPSIAGDTGTNHRTLRPWMTVAEAAEYSGLPESFLIDLIHRDRLMAYDVGRRPGGRFRISRKALDHLGE
jgi:excisionase family DNA binding protein